MLVKALHHSKHTNRPIYIGIISSTWGLQGSVSVFQLWAVGHAVWLNNLLLTTEILFEINLLTHKSAFCLEKRVTLPRFDQIRLIPLLFEWFGRNSFDVLLINRVILRSKNFIHQRAPFSDEKLVALSYSFSDHSIVELDIAVTFFNQNKMMKFLLTFVNWKQTQA